jgi:NAD(P)-dependent dehydrogenase (short-subunit alcohol dehydrogenase family)
MPGDFDGKVALVTGAASGIGRASAEIFGRRGAAVVVCDVNDEGGEETVSLIKEAGGEAAYRHLDVGDAAEVEAAVKFAVDTFGGLHCAHNNAGVVGLPLRIDKTPLDSWDEVMRVNLSGVFYCMKYELAHMVDNGGGAIVNTASISGMGASPLMSAYVASKHGVTGLTRMGGYDYAKKNIRVNAICPGVTATPMMMGWIDGDPKIQEVMDNSVPIGRMATPEEQAYAAVWLCSDEASFVSGVLLPVDGALTAHSGGGAEDDES